MTTPDTERKNVGNGVKQHLKRLLRKRRTLMLAMQVLLGIVKLMQALRDLFGGS